VALAVDEPARLPHPPPRGGSSDDAYPGLTCVADPAVDPAPLRIQADTPSTQEWRQLAAQKLTEVEQLLVRTQAMRALLHTWLNCDCLTLEDIDAFRQANADWAHAQQADA
jgi:hypothetical protein